MKSKIQAITTSSSRQLSPSIVIFLSLLYLTRLSPSWKIKHFRSTSSFTPSAHLFFGLPLPLTLSTSATYITLMSRPSFTSPCALTILECFVPVYSITLPGATFSLITLFITLSLTHSQNTPPALHVKNHHSSTISIHLFLLRLAR